MSALVLQVQKTLSAFVKVDRTKPENEGEIKKQTMEHSGTGKRRSDESKGQSNKKVILIWIWLVKEHSKKMKWLCSHESPFCRYLSYANVRLVLKSSLH